MRTIPYLGISLAIAASVAGASHAQWRGPNESVDPMTDVKITTIEALSVNQWSDPPRSSHAFIVVRCTGNQTELVVSPDTILRQNYQAGTVRVRYRLNDEPAVTEDWTVSKTHKAAFAPRWGLIPMLRRMAEADRLRIELPFVGGTSFVAEFNLAGFRNKIAAIEKACGWSPRGPYTPKAG